MVSLSSKEDTAPAIGIEDINGRSSVPKSLEGQYLSAVSSCHEGSVGARVRRLNLSTSVANTSTTLIYNVLHALSEIVWRLYALVYQEVDHLLLVKLSGIVQRSLLVDVSHIDDVCA